jgi:hypothetical protein
MSVNGRTLCDNAASEVPENSLKRLQESRVDWQSSNLKPSIVVDAQQESDMPPLTVHDQPENGFAFETSANAVCQELH